MAQATLIYLDRYSQRIQCLRTNGDQLLQNIKMLEIGMNRRKQRNETVHLEELNQMHWMVSQLLMMLAEIKTCKHFRRTYQIVRFSDEYYRKIQKIFFEDLLNRFNKRLIALEMNKDNEIHFLVL